MTEPVNRPFGEADSRPKPFVFVLMPFSKEFEGLYYGIKDACKSTGNHCERVDEQGFSGTIMSRIYNQIAKADLIISETTGRNPNVFYETGYAHALGKRVILLAETVAQIPFDVSGYPHVIHENSVKKLNGELTKLIPLVLQRDSSAPLAAFSLTTYLSDRRLKEGNVVRVIVPLASTKRDLTVKLRFAVNNPTNRILETENVEVGIIVPSEFCRVESRSAAPNGDLLANQLIRLPAQQNLHLIGGPKRLLPELWWNKDILFPVTDWPRLKECQLRATVRMFSETGYQDTNFQLMFVETQLPQMNTHLETSSLPRVTPEGPTSPR